MEDRIRLSYFYGKEADQFSFYKIPKLLFTEEYFKKISVEAKVLYGLMLDRMSLSMKNQWMDDEGRAYIYYSLEDIMEALGCSNKKAISIMKELDTDVGIGLIEKKRQGQGKPTMIYLKQFMVQDVQKCRNFTSEQKSTVSEVKNLHVLGHNGHIGFNEPAEVFVKQTHCVYLSEKTIQANQRFFESKEQVPKQAYTMGIGTIMSARKILIIISGEDKAEAVKKSFGEEISPHVPASILQLHHDVTVIADKAALSKLDI